MLQYETTDIACGSNHMLAITCKQLLIEYTLVFMHVLSNFPAESTVHSWGRGDCGEYTSPSSSSSSSSLSFSSVILTLLLVQVSLVLGLQRHTVRPVLFLYPMTLYPARCSVAQTAVSLCRYEELFSPQDVTGQYYQQPPLVVVVVVVVVVVC